MDDGTRKRTECWTESISELLDAIIILCEGLPMLGGRYMPCPWNGRTNLPWSSKDKYHLDQEQWVSAQTSLDWLEIQFRCLYDSYYLKVHHQQRSHTHFQHHQKEGFLIWYQDKDFVGKNQLVDLTGDHVELTPHGFMVIFLVLDSLLGVPVEGRANSQERIIIPIIIWLGTIKIDGPGISCSNLGICGINMLEWLHDSDG